MTVIQKLDLLSESLPKICLYCAYGCPCVYGIDSWFNCFVCMGHTIENLKSKKATLELHDKTKERIYLYAPLVGPNDSCDDFRPVKWNSDNEKQFVNKRKFLLLDEFGLFDDIENRPWRKDNESNSN